MKKTHLYGAVAATMLLAPVTANVLAAESDSLSEATEAQGVEEFSDSVVLPSDNGENNPADTGTGGEVEAPVIEGEGQPGEGATDPGTLDGITPEATDLGTEAGDEASKKEDNSSNDETGKSGIEDEAASNQKDVAKATVSNNLDSQTKEQPVVKAEDVVIPKVPTADTLVTVRWDEKEIYTDKLSNYFSQRVENIELTSGKNKIIENFSNEYIDWNNSLECGSGSFVSSIYIDLNDLVRKFNETYGVNYGLNSTYNSHPDNKESIAYLVYSQIQKKWILYDRYNTNPKEKKINFSVLLYDQNEVEKKECPSERENDSNFIKGEFLKKVPSISISVDGEEKVVSLNPEMLNVVHSYRAPDFCDVIINYDQVLKSLNLSGYRALRETETRYHPNAEKWDALYSNLCNSRMFAMDYKNGKWEMYTTIEIPELFKEPVKFIKENIYGIEVIENRIKNQKIHLIDVHDNNKIYEFDFIPGSMDYTYQFDQYYIDSVLHCAGKLDFNFLKSPYLDLLNKMQNKRYKLAEFDSDDEWRLILAVERDGSWIYPYEPNEVFFFIEPDESPAKPTHKIDYVKDGIILSGESTYDFEGEKFVAQEVVADSVKNPVISKLEDKVVYDLHFEDLKGNEVIHIGNYRIQLPIPQQLKGKNLILYHISNAGVRSEIPFKITSDQKIEFETSSFSLFVIGTVGDAGNQPQVPVDSNPSTNQKPSESITNVQQVSTSRVIRVEEQPLYGSLKTGIGLSRSDSATSHSADTGVSLNLKATLASFVLSGFGILGILKKRREAK